MVKKAFTLIELLVVIAIIGILATVLIVNFNRAKMKARDANREGIAKQVQTALTLYADDNSDDYPISTNATPTAAQFDVLAKDAAATLVKGGYLNSKIDNTKDVAGTDTKPYKYSSTTDGNTYTLQWYAENTARSGRDTGGYVTLTP